MSRDISQTRRALVSGATLGLLAGPVLIGQVARAQTRTGATIPAKCLSGDMVSLVDFGARGDGTDQTAAFHRARDMIQSLGSGTLRIPPGDYRLGAVLNSRFVHLQGAGNAASILRNSSAHAAIRATHASAGWEGTYLSDIGFEGTGPRHGVGFRAGDETLTSLTEYTGRFLFERVRFENLATGIERPFGNIGFDLTDCVFGQADFHIWSQGQPTSSQTNDPMHPGCLTLERGSMQGAHKASIYIDGRNVAGAGQVVLDGVRFEDNPGWILYIKDFNDRGPQPGIAVRSCWNENNYTARSVQIDGENSSPGFAKLINVPVISFEDTPIGPLTLQNSHVVTRGCNLDRLTSIAMDAGSSVTHHDARMYTGTAKGLVKSIGQLENTDARASLNTPWFPMPAPTAPRITDAAVLIASNAQIPERWAGNAVNSIPVADTALPWLPTAQQLTVVEGATLISPAAFVIPAQTWLVLQFVGRLISGPPPQVHINGSAGLGGLGHINDRDWRTYTAVVRNTGSAISGENVYIYSSGTDPAVVRFGGYAVTAFASSQAALAFANSQLFPSG